MNYVSVYGILTRKKLIKHAFSSFTIWCLPYKTPAVVSQYIWTQFSTIPLFSLGDLMMEHFAMFIGDGSHVFGKKIQIGMKKMKFQ